jgi:hypothetical protein
MAVAVLVNAAFLLYYNLREFSGHSQIHELAHFVRDHRERGEDVSAYQMPRRQRALGTVGMSSTQGMPRIQETSHPSIVMYLNDPIREPDDVPALLSDPRPQWVLTRWNRIQKEDLDAILKTGRVLKPVDTGAPQDLYRLFYLSGSPQSRSGR